ncbi:hypothetical protein XELAEV_18038152mg [Xenopus laevis]|uniref:Uncharacterized protein n=1 Tax=Xenopus laevis TaxID=8355 RepID=A0A974H770_XENLA|nr:hypothetical protein XELAEV_18038152mg [Xenopus laevis]
MAAFVTRRDRESANGCFCIKKVQGISQWLLLYQEGTGNQPMAAFVSRRDRTYLNRGVEFRAQVPLPFLCFCFFRNVFCFIPFPWYQQLEIFFYFAADKGNGVIVFLLSHAPGVHRGRASTLRTFYNQKD